MDKLDFKILNHLQEDSGLTNAELSKLVGLSPSACLGRTKRLKESGAIRKSVAVLSKKKVGLNVQAYTFLTLSPHDRKTTEAFLGSIREIPQVLECYNVSGKFDYLLKIIAPDIDGYRDFVIDTLIDVPGVEKIESQMVLGEVKHSHRLPLEKSHFYAEAEEQI